jgi:two-component system, chemotaxis family, protein-glutamate methylesterase/glutaminase
VDDTRPAAARGVVALGASAGGIDALQRLMRELPEDLAAAVCIVLHIPASSRSLLADIISRQTELPVAPATGGEPLVDGHVYVAPPDHHLRVRAGRIELDRGPKENGVRPAIDPLFRSAADAYGERAIAVVLSGSLSDGAGGAAAVAAAGGAVLVQDPADAVVPSMPESTLAAVAGAVSLPAAELAREIAQRARAFPSIVPEEVPVPVEPAGVSHQRRPPEGPPAALTCPECHGPLWELREGEVVRYRCRVGHAFYEDALLDGKAAAIESALWMALEALEERAELLEKIALRLEEGRREKSAATFREHARGVAERAELVRGVLTVGLDLVEQAPDEAR